jgi:hypothetical protein
MKIVHSNNPVVGEQITDIIRDQPDTAASDIDVLTNAAKKLFEVSDSFSVVNAAKWRCGLVASIFLIPRGRED